MWSTMYPEMPIASCVAPALANGAYGVRENHSIVNRSKRAFAATHGDVSSVPGVQSLIELARIDIPDFWAGYLADISQAVRFQNLLAWPTSAENWGTMPTDTLRRWFLRRVPVSQPRINYQWAVGSVDDVLYTGGGVGFNALSEFDAVYPLHDGHSKVDALYLLGGYSYRLLVHVPIKNEALTVWARLVGSYGQAEGN